MKPALDKVLLAKNIWPTQVKNQLRDFPIATAHDIIDRLKLEFNLNGGFDILREQRIRELWVELTDLLFKVEAAKKGGSGVSTETNLDGSELSNTV